MPSFSSVPDFSFGQLCQSAFKALKGNFLKSIGVIIIAALLHGAANALLSCILQQWAGFVINWLLFPLVMGGVLYFLRLVRQEPAPVASLFEPFKQYFRMLWGWLRVNLFLLMWSLPFFGVLAFLGYRVTSDPEVKPDKLLVLVLCIIALLPIIAAAFRYMFTYFIMLDYPQMSVRDCMKQSAKLVYGYKLRFFGYAMLWSFILIALIITVAFISVWLFQSPVVSIFVTMLIYLMVLPLCCTFITSCYAVLAASPDSPGSDDAPSAAESDDSVPAV